MTMNGLKLIPTPVTLNDMKNAVEFHIPHLSSFCIGKRNPKDKSEWIVKKDSVKRMAYHIKDGEDIVQFINDYCEGTDTPITVEYVKTMRGYKTVRPDTFAQLENSVKNMF